MSTFADNLQFPSGCILLSRWQSGDEAARHKLKTLFNGVTAGQFDAVFREPLPTNSVCVTTSLHLMTLTLLNRLYGLTSAEFYKGDPQRYVRTTLMTQRLLGISKLTLGWPVYAFGAETLGQAMIYPDQHAPGADPGEPLVNRTNWRELGTPDFAGVVPQVIEEMLTCFAELTGLEPVVHLPAPYSLAADIYGQESVITALNDESDFVVEFLDHLTDQVLVPWCKRLTQLIPNVWLELSDASGSPLFIGPSLFQKIAAHPIHRLIGDYPWGDRIFVANYRGDSPMKVAGERRRHRPSGRRNRRLGEPEVETVCAKLPTDAMIELIDFKLNLCPQFIIKLDADQSPLSIYMEQAIRQQKPLYLGIGATIIDRNSVTDHETAKQELRDLASTYAQAIKTVSKSLSQKGHSRSNLPWPGDVYIEDINAESDLGLVKIIIEEVARNGAIA